jgi:hypothetical protein
MEWQPIETAPKDGTEILCLDVIYGKPWKYVAIWNGIQWYTGYGDSFPNPKPTHYMLIPDIPEGYDGTCEIAPVGWRCTRRAGHEDPCAAWPV